ncbi:ST8SIA4 [Branchiostoma lanceolatum]|uniref:ST8SIA4 protein n=1 Tax=Branchiostoma lanceolatum TaxID=7740 RepID=A0A8K0EH60_BRALA|nr:ST8SIA4 [Branchiostoma lanceolatum]
MKVDLALALRSSPLRKKRSKMFRMDVNRIQYAFLFFVALSGSYFMGLITTLRSAPPIPIQSTGPSNAQIPPGVPQVGELRLVRRNDHAAIETDKLGAPVNGGGEAIDFEWGKGPPTSEEMRESFGGGDSGDKKDKEEKKNEEEEPEEEGGNVDYDIRGDAQKKDTSDEKEDAAKSDDDKKETSEKNEDDEPEEEGGNVDYDIRGDAHKKDTSDEKEDAKKESNSDEEEKSERKEKKEEKEDHPIGDNADVDNDLRTLISSKIPPGLDLVHFENIEIDVKKCFVKLQYIDNCNRDNAIKRRRTCAVVGNSGIISNSGCGKAIDEHDFVIRINFPNLKDHEKDVGEKTSLMLVGRNVLSVMYKCIKDKNECSVLKRLDDLDQTYIYHPEPLVDLETKTPRRPYKKFTYIKKYVSTKTHVVKFLYSMSNAQERVKELGRSLVERFPETPSNGAVAYSLALSFCDEVDLYGFFPFKQYQDKAVAKHYHPDPELEGDKFDEAALEREWSYMRELESRGALKFYIDTCTS